LAYYKRVSPLAAKGSVQMKLNLLANVLVITIIGFNPNHAMAYWKHYSKMNGAQGFYDPASIKRLPEDKVNVLTYINIFGEITVFPNKYKTHQKTSIKVLQQYQCKKFTYDFLETEQYSKSDLKGKSLGKNKHLVTEIRDIEEGSPADILIKIVCKK
jgi:hypothetical protein